MTLLSFTQNVEAYSLVAVRAELADLSEALSAWPGVDAYAPGVQVRSLDDAGQGLTEGGTTRTCFAVQLVDSPWVLLFQTVGWTSMEDQGSTRRLAEILSRQMRTTAASVCFREGAAGCIFTSGDSGLELEDDPGIAFEAFDDLAIHVPFVWIGTDGTTVDLFADPPSIDRIVRVDRFEVDLSAVAGSKRRVVGVDPRTGERIYRDV